MNLLDDFINPRMKLYSWPMIRMICRPKRSPIVAFMPCTSIGLSNHQILYHISSINSPNQVMLFLIRSVVPASPYPSQYVQEGKRLALISIQSLLKSRALQSILWTLIYSSPSFIKLRFISLNLSKNSTVRIVMYANRILH